ncbi:MAG: MaoC/PaaZ C-terminal domain-containing protein [Elusimicrobiota bacterium]
MGASLFFEDYKPGTTITTGGRTITEADIVNFACLSGDFNPIHTNVEHAKKGFGERIAHGLLGLAVLSGLIHEHGAIRESVVAFIHLDWRFSQVVKIGDTIHGTFVVDKVRAVGQGQGIVYFDSSIVNQKGETVGEGQWGLMIRKRP